MMKILFLVLIHFCWYTVAFGQQYGSSQAVSSRKSTPPPATKTPEENYYAAIKAYKRGCCHTADGFVRSITRTPSVVNGKKLLDDLRNNIKECIANKDNAELDEASGFNPATDDLSPLSISANQQIGYGNVQSGNKAFKARQYDVALQFYLQYFDDNFEGLIRQRDLLNQFEEKIEYCLSMLN